MFKQKVSVWLEKFPPLQWGLFLAVKIFGPRHYVGAMGVIFNDAGEVLLVEHVFRPHYNWGLPGGWVSKGENPADTVYREIEEELGLRVNVKQILLCDVQGNEPRGTTPLGLGLAYYCRLTENTTASTPSHGFEILSTQWLYPANIPQELTPLQQKAIDLGKEAFEQEQATSQKLAP